MNEVEALRAECLKLAHLLMSEYVWVHEYKIAEVDEALKPYVGQMGATGVPCSGGSGTASGSTNS